MINILVVEDHADTLMVLTILLKRQGYAVFGVSSSEEAIGIAASRRCDLLISDVTLPGLNGLELMKELKAQYGLKWIAMSGHVYPQDKTAAEDAGFDRFIAKPMEIDVLLREIRDLFPHKNALYVMNPPLDDSGGKSAF